MFDKVSKDVHSTVTFLKQYAKEQKIPCIFTGEGEWHSMLTVPTSFPRESGKPGEAGVLTCSYELTVAGQYRT